MKTFLGKGGQIGSMRVFLTDDCFEIEEESYVDLVRRRIFFDDILMVTHSRRVGWYRLAMPAIMCGVLALVSLGFVVDSVMFGAILFGIGALAFGTVFLKRLMSHVDVITVFGRRKRCEIAYASKPEQVKEHYELIVNAIQKKVAETTARIERERPPVPVPDLGPLPEIPATTEVVPTLDPVQTTVAEPVVDVIPETPPAPDAAHAPVVSDAVDIPPFMPDSITRSKTETLPSTSAPDLVSDM
ncbi:MAG: hypothetical protein WCL32_18785 [Planctomycetota bacterium]